jgi:predicted nucleotidyltransferase
MRLRDTERQAIVRAIRSADPGAAVYLFGSRVDDSAKGGDIDLLVVSRKIDEMSKLEILATLHEQLGDQRIDLVVFPDLSKPFARLAANEGRPL